MGENHALIPGAMYIKPDPSESKEARNLMSGDFERQYRRDVSEQSGGGGRRWPVWTALGALLAWLLVITVLRELQVAHLQQQVDNLRADLIVVSARVNSLDDKIQNNKLFNEFSDFQDQFYADNDDFDKEKVDQDTPLVKLQGLTVLEDDTQLSDDEDSYDEEGDESGDYMDYGRRSEGNNIGKTNMVHLTPEDFTDTVLHLDMNNPSGIREIKRILNQDPANPDIPLYLKPKQSSPPQPSSTEAADSERSKRSVFPDSAADPVSAMPRHLAKADERRKTKKYIPPSGSDNSHSVSRTVRNSDDEDSRRPFIAAHFHGNTSHLNPGVHEHYKGNGLVRVSHDAAHDVWYPSPWTMASPHPRPTLTRNGHVHVHHTGVYLVYAQIYYLDSHDIISWVLHRTNPDIEGRETLLQCAQSSHSSERLDKPNSCFSASALFLKAGDKLAVRNTGGDRHSLMQPEKSFIGLIKLADADDPDQEF